LAMDKAMQRNGGFEPPRQHQAYNKGQVRTEESSMANEHS
jgi:hypothetical protein